MRRNLLIVSERGSVRASLAEMLRSQDCSVTLVDTEADALEVVKTVAVDAVLIESAPKDQRSRRLRAKIREARPHCRVVSVTSFEQARRTADLLSFGPYDYLLAADELLELIRPSSAPTADLDGEQIDRGIAALVEVIDVLVGLLELDDRFFGGSSHQAMRLARAVSKEMGVEPDVIAEVVLATLLRDIGKSGLDLETLSEEGKFSEEQKSKMRGHVTGSMRLLEHIDFPWKVLPIIRHHHERYDGTGYPGGLRGREIPIGARIVSLVDAYVAMTSDRAHRAAAGPREALEEIVSQAGSQFDPEVVEVFLRVTERKLGGGVPTAKPTVMIAEPEADVRKMIKVRLLNEGLKVQALSNVDKARRRIFKSPPDLVLAAVESEDDEGFKLLADVREHQKVSQLPFVLMGQKNDRILKVRALRQGADDFVSKTADLEELVARVENILSRESARRSGGSAPRRSGISGSIENMPLTDIVQTLTIGMKTACVTLATDEAKGDIWFREGRITHAELGKEEAEPAFYEMLRWRTGEFMIRHGITAERSTIDSDPMFLVLEGLRLMDHETMENAEAS